MKEIPFSLQAPYQPTGDQPQAIDTLVNSLNTGNRHQTLLGVTGSGKTFTMANVIQKTGRPTLVICHNKTLAAQLFSEFKVFFPNNAVEYFISYYDYYQPEAYIPQTDTHIEKDASINDDIERFRIAATSSLLSRKDVIVVASVSCIYGLGSPEDFQELVIFIETNMPLKRDRFLEYLVKNRYERHDMAPARGKFRVRGQTVDVYPANMSSFIRIEFLGDTIESISEHTADTGKKITNYEAFSIYPANQYITSPKKLESAIKNIRKELEERVSHFEKNQQLIEAQRIRMRTEYDLEMLREIGYCSGIENYSLHLSGRSPGSRPWCLLDFFPNDFLTIIDESHVTIPQIRGMYFGDRSRKTQLVEYGFRLPSALENRPLKPEEFDQATNQILFVSATPAAYELQISTTVAEQIIRPTGLVDPVLEIYPCKGQVEHLLHEIHTTIANGDRILVTTLTKRMSEDLTAYLRKMNIRVEYLHSDIDAIERVEILRRLREGAFDVLVGINLLREGLDLPEVALVAILDADKEGFLRSETSIIQTAGRAARHEKGRVLLYADKLTDSIKRAIKVTDYRRKKQLAYNKKHNITPTSVKRSVQTSLQLYEASHEAADPVSLNEAKGNKDRAAVIAQLESEMIEAADNLQFEKAALLRDQIARLKNS